MLQRVHCLSSIMWCRASLDRPLLGITHVCVCGSARHINSSATAEIHPTLRPLSLMHLLRLFYLNPQISRDFHQSNCFAIPLTFDDHVPHTYRNLLFWSYIEFEASLWNSDQCKLILNVLWNLNPAGRYALKGFVQWDFRKEEKWPGDCQFPYSTIAIAYVKTCPPHLHRSIPVPSLTFTVP